MGWMGREQVRLLLESGGLGLLLGAMFDVCCAISRGCGRRRWLRFCTDAAFGVPAALLTFFGSLAIMDGRMHPLLLFGMAVGFWVQHRVLGRAAARWLYKLGRGIGRATGTVMKGIDGCIGAVCLHEAVIFRRLCGHIFRKPSAEAVGCKSVKKNHIFFNFFKKKS